MSPEPRKERKVVTVVFADLVGFTARAETLDPEDVEAILSPYHSRLRDELERFGGTVEKFIGDAVMAVFGATRAREDDPERAVRAALAIRDWAVEQEGLEVRIAVATGEALVALDARPKSGEAMVAGDVVNTAARLQSAAPVNGVLVGETTWRATSASIDYAEREPVSAKGKAQPVPVWEAVAARARFGVDPGQRGGGTLVGREEELDLLVDALARARRERAPQLLPGEIPTARVPTATVPRRWSMRTIRPKRTRSRPAGGSCSKAAGERTRARSRTAPSCSCDALLGWRSIRI